MSPNRGESVSKVVAPSKDKLYGPWMQVVSLKRMVNSPQSDGHTVVAASGELQLLVTVVEMDIQGTVGALEGQGSGSILACKKSISPVVGESSKQGA
ncbi:hypothetical protein V6N13_006264 [Hibiscus sabdariffa]